MDLLGTDLSTTSIQDEVKRCRCLFGRKPMPPKPLGLDQEHTSCFSIRSYHFLILFCFELCFPVSVCCFLCPLRVSHPSSPDSSYLCLLCPTQNHSHPIQCRKLAVSQGFIVVTVSLNSWTCCLYGSQFQ